jgi:hypothetical protein
MVRLSPLDGEGRGGVRLRLPFINRTPNRIHDRSDILVQFLVSEADHAEATRG